MANHSAFMHTRHEGCEDDSAARHDTGGARLEEMERKNRREIDVRRKSLAVTREEEHVLGSTRERTRQRDRVKEESIARHERRRTSLRKNERTNTVTR